MKLKRVVLSLSVPRGDDEASWRNKRVLVNERCLCIGHSYFQVMESQLCEYGAIMVQVF